MSNTTEFNFDDFWSEEHKLFRKKIQQDLTVIFKGAIVSFEGTHKVNGRVYREYYTEPCETVRIDGYQSLYINEKKVYGNKVITNKQEKQSMSTIESKLLKLSDDKYIFTDQRYFSYDKSCWIDQRLLDYARINGFALRYHDDQTLILEPVNKGNKDV